MKISLCQHCKSVPHVHEVKVRLFYGSHLPPEPELAQLPIRDVWVVTCPCDELFDASSTSQDLAIHTWNVRQEELLEAYLVEFRARLKPLL